jgi:GTPase
MTEAARTGVTRCGFVAILGAPNAGKSTLVNRIVGQKVSIVSPKVQTTRNRVLGIAMRDLTQLILVDTPGIFKPRRRLDRAMVSAAWAGAGDADQVVLLVDAARKGIDEDTRGIVAGLKANGRKAILVLNKVDIARREKLLALTAELNALGDFTDVFMISAETGDGVEDLVKALALRMREGPYLFPEDQLTDAPMRMMSAEITREHLFRQLHDEVPYALTVETEAWEEFQDGSAKVSQVVFVERDSQKAIVLGKGGQKIKAVREAAQAELERMFERRIHLFLFVKVRENWGEERDRFRELGLDFDV